MKHKRRWIKLIAITALCLIQMTSSLQVKANDNLPTIQEIQDKKMASPAKDATTKHLYITYVDEDGLKLGEDHITTTQNYISHKGPSFEGYESPYDEFIFLTSGTTYHTTTYYHKQYTLSVNAVDSSGKVLDTFTFTNRVNETHNIVLDPIKVGSTPYVPKEKSFLHVFTEDETIDVLYEPQLFTLTVNLFDNTDRTYLDSVHVTGHYQEQVTVLFPEIDGYYSMLDSMPYYILSDSTVAINYYRKDINLEIDYVLPDGSVLDSDVYTAAYKDRYDIELKEFYGYEFSSYGNNGLELSGYMPSNDQKITINLKPMQIEKSIKYKDDLGNIVYSNTIQGMFNEYYTVDIPDVAGYHHNEESEIFHFTDFEPEIISNIKFVRSEITLDIEYLLPNGDILDTDSFSKFYLDDYDYSQKLFFGYEFDHLSNDSLDLKGIMPSTNGKISIMMKPKGIDKTIRYQDDLGNIIYSEFIQSFYNEDYTVQLPDFDGYHLDKNSELIHLDNFDSEYVSEIQYQRNEVKIDVEYLLPNGELLLADSIKGLYKDEYSYTPQLFYGYEFVKLGDDSIALNGSFPHSDTKIIIQMQPKKVSKTILYKDDLGNTVYSEYIDSYYDEQHLINLPNIDGYHLLQTSETINLRDFNNEDVSTIQYLRNDVSLTYVYQLSDGTVLDSQNVNGKYLENFEYPLSDIYGYDIESLSLDDILLKGNMPTENQTFVIKLMPKAISKTFIYNDDIGNAVYEEVIHSYFNMEGYISLPQVDGYETMQSKETYKLTTLDTEHISTIKYKRKSYKLNTNYISEDGKTIKSTTQTVKYKDDYIVTPEKINPYTFVEVKNNASLSGNMPSSDVTIDIVMRKVEATSVLPEESNRSDTKTSAKNPHVLGYGIAIILSGFAIFVSYEKKRKRK